MDLCLGGVPGAVMPTSGVGITRSPYASNQRSVGGIICVKKHNTRTQTAPNDGAKELGALEDGNSRVWF